jgi:hypothetical protein
VARDRRTRPNRPARYHSGTRTVTFALDVTTAIDAIAAHADDREARTREIQLRSHHLPDGSSGRCNRQAIAARVIRLDTNEQAHRTAIEPSRVYESPEPLEAPRTPERATDEVVAGVGFEPT